MNAHPHVYKSWQLVFYFYIWILKHFPLHPLWRNVLRVIPSPLVYHEEKAAHSPLFHLSVHPLLLHLHCQPRIGHRNRLSHSPAKPVPSTVIHLSVIYSPLFTLPCMLQLVFSLSLSLHLFILSLSSITRAHLFKSTRHSVHFPTNVPPEKVNGEFDQ